MTIKDKVFTLDSTFSKELPNKMEQIDSIYIEGYASTNDVDRAGDVVPTEVWEAGIKNYLKNPVILWQHEREDPCGRMESYRVDSNGLWVKARISAASEEAFNLVKDGVVTAFSVAFRVLDAIYDNVTDLFVIKELELLEISVVSIPANQNTLFSLAKSFTSEDEYKAFKKQFATVAVDKSQPSGAASVPQPLIKKEVNMTTELNQEQIAAISTAAAEKAVQDLLATQAREKAAADKAAIEKKAEEDRIAAIVHKSTTGAEQLMAELQKRAEAQEATGKSFLDGLAAEIKEKREELEALQKSKMSFADNANGDPVSYQEKENVVFLRKMYGSRAEGSSYIKNVLAKAQNNPHLPAGNDFWATTVSTTLEKEIRDRLVVANVLRQIPMQQALMQIPVNPDATKAGFVANTTFGSNPTLNAGPPQTNVSGSAGTYQAHQLKAITLEAFKVAGYQYLSLEEEADSMIPLMPILRDALVRGVSKAIDWQYLLGTGATAADPFRGLANYDATSVVTPAVGTGASVATMQNLRKDLGYMGLDPAELVYIVSPDVYFQLLADTNFLTVDKAGPNATLFTGQVGSVGNTPVLVSNAFPASVGGVATAQTNIGAVCVYKPNFLAGNLGTLRMDSDVLVESQRSVLVASMRTGMTSITQQTALQGVSTLRWAV